MNTRMISMSMMAILAITMLMAMPAARAQTEDEEALESIGFDDTPEFQALKAALEAQWETCTQNPAAPGCSPPPQPPVGGAAGAYNACFPTCDTKDSRMLVLAGSGLVTLAGDSIRLGIGSPAGSPALEMGIFDGDTSRNWDIGGTVLEYTLFADPAGDGSGTLQLGQWSSTVMLNNAWYEIAMPNNAAALTPSGNYLYWLRVRNTNPTVYGANAFKVGVNGSVVIKPGAAFSVISSLYTTVDVYSIYPNYPSLTPTTYDGTWDFYVDMLPNSTYLSIWDGDMDFGDWLCANNDTNDPNTPGAAFVPPWAVGTAAVPEGVAVGSAVTGGCAAPTGAPVDDYRPGVFVRTPNLVYEAIPLTASIACKKTSAPVAGGPCINDNPSGNLEWENFRVDSALYDPSMMDYQVTSSTLPGGIWQITVYGMDLSNLNAWRFEQEVLGVPPCENPPCEPEPPLKPYRVGDLVWYDTNADGVRDEGDEGELGLPNVIVNLVDGNGTIIRTTLTANDGWYNFNVDPGTYTVQVAPENFQAGGVLAPYTTTTFYTPPDPSVPNQRTQTVVDQNLLDYDFGYVFLGGQYEGAIGDTVWYDINSDGDQDAGEPGLDGLTVKLQADTNNDGSFDFEKTTTTQSTPLGVSGQYLFTGLPPGHYTVTVMNPPSYLVETYDYDGLSTPNAATLSLGSNEVNLYVDFGYGPLVTALFPSLGDYVWEDKNGDGIQNDGADAGISGVTVKLFGNDGSEFTTTTDNNGYYEFKTLLPDVVYTAKCVLPAGYNFTLTYDQDRLLGNNSNANPATGEMGSYALGMNESLPTVDAGLVKATVSLGDYVWADTNGNGVQDANEPGINGVTVKLYQQGGTSPIATTLTVTDLSSPNPSQDGFYSFSGLTPGNYFVEFVNPGGYVFTLPLQGGDPAKDSNADPITGRTGIVTLAAGEFNPTIDAGLVPGQDQCPPDGITLPGDGKAGKLYVWQDASSVYARYDQSTNLNDNSYGVNQVGWGANAPSGKSHTFSNLTGSDKAEFIFKNSTGTTVLDFYSDYITATTVSSSFPSGYKSLGPFGGDGSCVTGNCTLWVKDYNSSLAENLNNFGYCTNGSCVVSGVDLEVNSPPTTSPTSYTLQAGSPFTKWNFVNSFYVKIDKAAFGTNGFGSVEMGIFHNSPAKIGDNAIDPKPCVDGPTPSCSISAGTPTVSTKNFNWPLTNGESTKVTLNQITATWPATNGSLSKAKFDKDVIWDGTMSCVSGTCSATITTAQMITDSKKKSIDPGKTRKFSLEFQNNAGTTLTNYTVSLSFGSGCEVSYGQPPVSCTGVIGDLVWNDANGNGIQDTGEAGIPGVSVALSQNGAVKSTVATNAGGYYQFSGLCANTYGVTVAAPFGYTPTITSPPGTGTSETDSNPSPSTVVLTTDDGKDLTVDFGFKSTGGISMCPTTPTAGFGTTNPVGLLFVTDNSLTNPSDQTVTVRYVQNKGLNDNSYGANQVGWGTNAPSGSSHTFSSLTGSDSAQFTFFNGAGTKVLDFEIDYLSAKAGTPSGYGTLGVSGGDGGMLTGSATNVLAAMTSLDVNLNSNGFCVSGNCSGGGTNLLSNSPPTTSSTSYTLPAGSPYGAWQFTNWYEVKVSKTLLTGNWKVQMGTVHNSPPKAGTNAVVPIPCP